MAAFHNEQRIIYFVKPISMDGPIKIGSTLSVKERICQLDGWSPFPLEVIATMPGTLRMEKDLHKRFAASRSHKEWFHPTSDLLAYIAAERRKSSKAKQPEAASSSQPKETA